MMKKTISISAFLIFAFALSQSAYLEVKAHLAQFLIANAWEVTLKTKQNTKPWSWADTWPVLEIELPSGKTQYVLNSISGQAMAFGPGHMIHSGLPGENKDIVISAHRDTHFASLEQIEVGQIIRVKDSSNQPHNYIVRSTEIIDSTKRNLYIETGSEKLRLITCYPFDALSSGGSLRYVVTALPTDKI